MGGQRAGSRKCEFFAIELCRDQYGTVLVRRLASRRAIADSVKRPDALAPTPRRRGARAMARILLVLCATPYQSVALHSVSYTGTARLGPARSNRIVLLEDGNQPDSLATAFARERLRRELMATSKETTEDSRQPEEPFSGIKEIVLADGKPMAIPRRPVPPPATTMQGEIVDLTSSPLFLFGCVISLGSLVLILAIAQADVDAF